MTDEVDLANDFAEASLAHALAMIGKGKEAEETGHCLNCGEPVKPGHRWCDIFCRNDWTARRGK